MIGDSIKRVLSKIEDKSSLAQKRKKLDDLFIPPGVFGEDVEKALSSPVESASGSSAFGKIKSRIENVSKGLNILPITKLMRDAVENRDIFAYQAAENRLRGSVDFDRELPAEMPDPESIKRAKRRDSRPRRGRASTILTSGLGGGSRYGLGG